MSTASHHSSSGGERARVVMALDFGTTFSGFAHAHTAEPDQVLKFYEWPCMGKVGAKPYCKTQTSLYYEPILKHGPQYVGRSQSLPAALQLKSWGWSAEVEKVLRLIEKQVRGVRVLMVVGGFAASPYLRKSIRDKFRGMVDEIMVPEDPGSAICHGAVRLHIANDIIQSRIVKKTYGIRIRRRAVRGDPAEFVFVNDDGVLKCYNTFLIFVRKKATVPLGHSVKNSVSPSVHGQRSIDIVLYSSTKRNPKFMEGEDRVMKEGSFTVDI